jgi:hypothetical protein
MRFFKLSNSEEECLVHINWLKDELKNCDKYVADTLGVVMRVADELE